ncbi:hypothetical protein GCM10025872_02730 [Barrientosiimonas endolithica]|uniref:Uncharacterized protein n=1 Tax=Barrientosiimonas endolithica TaxID=1535208 RepID=A0ABN6YHM6_9MICO|nr:hypothetical protein GCM10025872_02730 [Barrientosiimonas endolithica]
MACSRFSGSVGSWNIAMYQLRLAWSLRSIAQFSARGCGVDSTVSDATRCGTRSPRVHATAPPQS